MDELAAVVDAPVLRPLDEAAVEALAALVAAEAPDGSAPGDLDLTDDELLIVETYDDHELLPVDEAETVVSPSRRTRAIAALGAAACLIGVCVAAVVAMAPPPGEPGERVVDIPKSASLGQIATQLEERGIISNALAFRALATVTGIERALQAGTYRLPAGTWAWTVLAELHRGQVQTQPVTVPEGLTLREIAELLEREGVVSSARFIKAARDPQLLAPYGIPGPSAEGFLFPETYRLAAGLDAREVVRVMLDQFFERIRALPGGDGLSGERLVERVTLASIVEREARAPEERRRIAGVFQNRLDRNMRLESCATVQYVLGSPKARLTREDLRVMSPFNTYLTEGLPPGPISNPGEEALAAALDPEEHEYLFFVAREDGSGRHVFTRTFAAHQAAQRRLRGG